MLHGVEGHPKTNYLLNVAKAAGQDLAFTPVNTKSKDAAKISPLRRFPVLQKGDLSLADANGAARFLASETNLCNGSEERLLQVENWLDFTVSELDPAFNAWIDPIMGQKEIQPSEHAGIVSSAMTALEVIEASLSSQKQLAGSDYSLADIAVANSLVNPFRMVLDEATRSKFPALTAWFNDMLSKQDFSEVWGKIHLCRAQMPFPEPKSAKAKPAKKPAAPKKEAKPAQEEAPAIPKKPVNPLDLLPPTPLILDEWKKLYSNHADLRECMQEFWKLFDKEGWSLWHCHYEKIEGECEKVYMTNNMLNGFLQRMEAMRKYSFGYLGIYGDEPDLEIVGCFFWRGLTIPQEMIDHPQFEYYKTRQLDSENADDRALVEDYWCNIKEDTKIEGRTWQNGKCWK